MYFILIVLQVKDERNILKFYYKVNNAMIESPINVNVVSLSADVTYCWQINPSKNARDTDGTSNRDSAKSGKSCHPM